MLQLGGMRGLVSIAKNLLKKGAGVNAAGGGYGTARQVALYCGVEFMVQMFLDERADANAKPENLAARCKQLKLLAMD